MRSRNCAHTQSSMSSSRRALLDGTGYRGKDVVGIRANQPNSADNNDQNHSQHNSVLSDVLPAIVVPQLAHHALHDFAFTANQYWLKAHWFGGILFQTTARLGTWLALP